MTETATDRLVAAIIENTPAGVSLDSSRSRPWQEIIDAAREGRYHDFRSPLPFPKMSLVADLRRVSGSRAERDFAASLTERVRRGEFDESSAEAEAWLESEEGEAARGRAAGLGRSRALSRRRTRR